jgi:hypothetical protein
MNLYAIRRRDDWASPAELQGSATKSAKVGDETAGDVRWIRTYVIQVEIARMVAAGLGFGPDKIDYKPIPSAAREDTRFHDVARDERRRIRVAGPLAHATNPFVRGSRHVLRLHSSAGRVAPR